MPPGPFRTGLIFPASRWGPPAGRGNGVCVGVGVRGRLATNGGGDSFRHLSLCLSLSLHPSHHSARLRSLYDARRRLGVASFVYKRFAFVYKRFAFVIANKASSPSPPPPTRPLASTLPVSIAFFVETGNSSAHSFKTVEGASENKSNSAEQIACVEMHSLLRREKHGACFWFLSFRNPTVF